MKIIDIQRFIDSINFLNEAMSLNDLRKKLIQDEKGEGKSLIISKNEQKWNDKNKNHLIKILNLVVGKDREDDLKSLTSFDTTPYFDNKELKPKSLSDDLGRKISAVKQRVAYSLANGDNVISNQYEMMEIKNGVEVYAVYTPIANATLTHKILRTETQPSWCIASSSAPYYWSFYKLYNAYCPAVFIVAQKLPDGTYNDMKYELKCNPNKTWDFATYEWITLPKLVDEWRNPIQSERTYKETSLFKNFDITLQELTNTIRKLMKTDKAKSFSENFGMDMMLKFKNKIKKNKNDEERIEFLIKACQNGLLNKFYKQIKKDEREFFIERLIEYNTLFENDVVNLEQKSNKKAILNLAKNKRCTSRYSLEWAIENFEEDVVKKVIFSLEEPRLNSGTLDMLWKNKLEESASIIMRTVLADKISFETDILEPILFYKKEEYLKPVLKLLKKHNKIRNRTLAVLLKYKKGQYTKSILKKLAEKKDDDVIRTVIDFIFYKIDKKYINHFLEIIKEKNPFALETSDLMSILIKNNMSEQIMWCLENCNYIGYFNFKGREKLYEEMLQYNDNEIFERYFHLVIDYFNERRSRDNNRLFETLIKKGLRINDEKKKKIMSKIIFDKGDSYYQNLLFLSSIPYGNDNTLKYVIKRLEEKFNNGYHDELYNKRNVIYQLETHYRDDMIDYIKKNHPSLLEEN